MHVEKGAKQVHYESGPDMTPLVDVVMVLLIFLMMVGKFGGATKYLVSNLPISSSGPGAPPPEGFVPETPVTITVTSPLPDQFNAFVGNTPADNEEKLEAAIKSQLAGMVATGKKAEDVQVFIKPAKNVRYAQVVRVYASALKAGAVKIGFQAAGG